jgi:hypothetical protein
MRHTISEPPLVVLIGPLAFHRPAGDKIRAPRLRQTAFGSENPPSMSDCWSSGCSREFPPADRSDTAYFFVLH